MYLLRMCVCVMYMTNTNSSQWLFRHTCLYYGVQTSPGQCLVVSEEYLFCGCSEGVVRIFDPFTLDYLVTLPLPHRLGVNLASVLDPTR